MSSEFGSLLKISVFGQSPWPGHADWAKLVKWGGGPAATSPPLTAPLFLCIAGGIAKQMSPPGRIRSLHPPVRDGGGCIISPLRPTKELLDAVVAKPFPVLDDQAGERMQALILEARKKSGFLWEALECRH